MAQARLALVGDVQINRDDPASAFERLQPLLDDADLRVCQLEATMSDRGTVRRDVQNPHHRVPPEMVEGLAAAGFDAVTFAGNNNVDYGPEAMFDTVDRLADAGIATVGVGEDVDDAREPVVLEAGGTTVALVDACSILRSGYAATADRPGLAPLRVSTFYETLENVYEQPGTPARTVTVPDEHDLRAYLATVEAAADAADFVVACHHAGVHFTYDLATYQPDVAYAAVEAGADAVVGTHAHNLQAVDVHRGAPVCYSLGNVVFDQPGDAAADRVAAGYLRYYGMSTDSGAANYPHPRHTRDSMLVHLDLGPDGAAFELHPVHIADDATPEPADPDGPDGARIVALLRALSAEVGVELEREGDRLVLGDPGDVDARLWVRERMGSYPWLARLQTLAYGDAPADLVDVL